MEQDILKVPETPISSETPALPESRVVPEVKRRGRPKGSLNKPKDPNAPVKEKGRPGRPKGSRNKKMVFGSIAVDSMGPSSIPEDPTATPGVHPARYESGFLVTDYTVTGKDRCPVCQKKSRKIVSFPVERLADGTVRVLWSSPRVSHLHRTTLVVCFEVFDDFCEESSGVSVVRNGGWVGGGSEIQRVAGSGTVEIGGVLQENVPRVAERRLPGHTEDNATVLDPTGGSGV